MPGHQVQSCGTNPKSCEVKGEMGWRPPEPSVTLEVLLTNNISEGTNNIMCKTLVNTSAMYNFMDI